MSVVRMTPLMLKVEKLWFVQEELYSPLNDPQINPKIIVVTLKWSPFLFAYIRNYYYIIEKTAWMLNSKNGVYKTAWMLNLKIMFLINTF